MMQKSTTPQIDLQLVTPELRAWIVDQAKAGFDRQALLASMLASGWHEAVAAQALGAIFPAQSAQTPQSHEPSPPQAVQLTAEVASTSPKLPEPLTTEAAYVLKLADREVHVLSQMETPRVVVLGGLLSHDECDELVELARVRLARSQTVQTETGGSEVNEARTSEGMFFRREENPLCARIEARIAALLDWPIENGEGLQVLRYQPGAQYKPHHDYFDPAQSGTAAILKRGGQRVATLVMYLNTPTRGGATTFPDVMMEVAPIKGNAVFFSYDKPDPSTKTLHGGAPVIEGEKWVATKWLREGEFI